MHQLSTHHLPPQILSDILGSEDALGDMDFKVRGFALALELN